MSVRSAQSVTSCFNTYDPSTGALADATGTPVGTLVVNGTNNAASVTVTNRSTGDYKFAVTLPTLAAGDIVQMKIAATVSGTASARFVWGDTCDLALDSSGFVDFSASAIQKIARAIKGPGNVYYVLPSGNNSNSGLTPALAKLTISGACSVATAGDTILFNGTIAQTTTQVAVPAGVLLKGASMATAIITTTNITNACVTAAGDGVTFEDFTIRGIATDTPYDPTQVLIGYHTGDTVTKNVVVRRVFTDGNADGSYFRNSSGSTEGYWRFEDCRLKGKYDCHVCFGTNANQSFDFYRTTFIASGPTTVAPSNDILVGCRAVSPAQGITRLYECIVIAETTDITAESNVCIYARTGTGSAARIEVYRTLCITKTPTGYTTVGVGGPDQVGGLEHHLRCAPAAGGFTPTLYAQDVNYDTSKVSGTVTIQNTPISGTGQVRAGALATDVIDAASLKTDAVTEIQSGLATSTALAAVKTDTGNLITNLASLAGKFTGITLLARWLGLMAGKTADASTLAEMQATTAGATYSNTTDSQEAVRDRGDAAWITGSGGATLITPVQANSSNPRYSTRAMANIGQGSAPTDLWQFDDAEGEPINLSGKTIRLVFAQVADEGEDEDDVVDDTVEASFQYETSGDGLTVGGADSNQVTLVHDATKTATVGEFEFFWWNATDKVLLAKGTVNIEPTAFSA